MKMINIENNLPLYTSESSEGSGSFASSESSESSEGSEGSGSFESSESSEGSESSANFESSENPENSETPEKAEFKWLRQRIEYLAEFMTPERMDTLRTTISKRTRSMTILTENTFHSQNASALMRHCEAFGLQDLHAVETLCRFTTHRDIVRGTDKWVDIKRYETTAEALKALKGEGYRIVATTPHREDHTPESFDVTAGKFALVFGTEHAGISDEIIENADEFLRIPMCGMVESLNVSASAAILIYMLSERMRLSTDNWQLPEIEQTRLLYRWMKSSVKDSDGVLKRKFEEF